MNNKYAFMQYVFAEMSKFQNTDDLDNFCARLLPEIEALCEKLSKSRKNCVYRFIKEAPGTWTEVSVPIEKIKVGKINSRVNPILERHGHHLARIVQDPEAIADDEFKSQGEIPPGLSTLIAKHEGDHFRLVDGNHRAIRMGMNGVAKFTLLTPD